MRTPFNLIQSLGSWFFRNDGDIILQSGRTIVVSDTGVTVTIDNNGIVITGTGDVTIGGTSVSLDGHAHAVGSHTIASHSDTTGTGAELNTLTDGSNADALHAHAVGSHTIASHSDTSGTGAELNTLTDGSDASSLHDHDGRYFQESEFSSSPGASSKPLETGASGGLTLVGLSATSDIQAASGMAIGNTSQNPPNGVFMFPEIGAPGTPPSGWVYLYAKTTGRMYSKDDTGTESSPL